MSRPVSRWLSSDGWLSELLGKAAYRLAVDDALIDAGDIAARDARERLVDLAATESFVYAKVSSDRIDYVRWLENEGFSLVDTTITLRKQVTDGGRGDRAPSPSFSVAMTRPEDEDAVARVAGRSFVHSRFHADPLIPDHTAHAIKERWARNFFRNRRGDAMVVAKQDGTVIGFNQLLKPENTRLIIDLIAVDAAHQGRGVAREMIRFAEASFPGIAEVVVGTQLANVASLHLYQSAGFRMWRSTYAYHRHGGPDKSHENRRLRP